ncbi:Dolichyl-phosphate-mannose-protein mannosyltransferase [uncultured archaeon]|nr:Dolichyl-phosphate-mannose-protein mannosyltransferase [uncultured archaeon]
MAEGHKRGRGRPPSTRPASGPPDKLAARELFPVLLVFLLGFGFFLWIFSRDALIPMVDGPYYLIQVRSILATGGLAYGAPPLPFYLLSAFAFLLGDITLGVKVGVSFFCALSAIPAYLLMRRVGKSRSAGILAMLLVIFSAPYVRMLADFMKNAVGVFFLFMFIYYLHELASSWHRRRSLALASLFLVLTGMSHSLDLFAAILFFAVYAVLSSALNADRRRFMGAACVLALVVSAFMLVSAVFFSAMFSDFGPAFSLIQRIFQPDGAGGAAVSGSSGLGPQAGAPPLSDGIGIIGGWAVVMLVFMAGAFLSYRAWKEGKREQLSFLLAATAMVLVICFPLIPGEWLFRTSLMFVVPASMILSYGISRLWAPGDTPKAVAIAVSAACLLASAGQCLRVAMDIGPTISDEGYLDLVGMKGSIPPGSIVFTEHSIVYWVRYVDGADVAGIPIQELSPETWESYPHVLFIFPKDGIPPVAHEPLFVGKDLLLAEVRQAG